MQKIKLPKSSKKILLLLAEEATYEGLTQKEIIVKSSIPAKTVRYALKKLSAENLIITKPSLLDMRSSFYSLNPDFNLATNEILQEAKLTIQITN